MKETTLSLTDEINELNIRYGVLSKIRSDSCYNRYAKHVSKIDDYKKSIEEELRDLVFHEYKYQFLIPHFVGRGRVSFTVCQEGGRND